MNAITLLMYGSVIKFPVYLGYRFKYTIYIVKVLVVLAVEMGCKVIFEIFGDRVAQIVQHHLLYLIRI